MPYDFVHNEKRRKSHRYEDICEKLQSERFETKLFISSKRFDVRQKISIEIYPKLHVLRFRS